MNKVFNKEVFGKRLLELMQQNGDTTYSLAGFLHLSPPTISRYTNGEMSPKITAIEAISTKYNVNPAWLMGAEGVDKYLEDINQPKAKKIPILSAIIPGQSIIIEKYIEGYECINQSSKVDFCFRVKEDSMSNARIYHGDMAYIIQQSDVDSGQIALVSIDNEEATLKRVYKYPGTIVLRQENPKYSELIFQKKDFKRIKIIGKCTDIRFSV